MYELCITKKFIRLPNVEFCGDAHDPLYDAYNLYILDKISRK